MTQTLGAYAVRDLDGDEIPDYRIGKDGILYEGDDDVDGDGVFNALDASPYNENESYTDENENGIQ